MKLLHYIEYAAWQDKATDVTSHTSYSGHVLLININVFFNIAEITAIRKRTATQTESRLGVVGTTF